LSNGLFGPYPRALSRPVPGLTLSLGLTPGGLSLCDCMKIRSRRFFEPLTPRLKILGLQLVGCHGCPSFSQIHFFEEFLVTSHSEFRSSGKSLRYSTNSTSKPLGSMKYTFFLNRLSAPSLQPQNQHRKCIQATWRTAPGRTEI